MITIFTPENTIIFSLIMSNDIVDITLLVESCMRVYPFHRSNCLIRISPIELYTYSDISLWFGFELDESHRLLITGLDAV